MTLLGHETGGGGRHGASNIAIGDKPKNPKGGIFIIDGSEQ